LQLQLQTFQTWVQQQAAAMQASATTALNFTTGSVLRALVEANTSVMLWVQWLVLQVLAITRAGTSLGPDLDTWMADFSFARIGAVASTGTVTFARYTVGQQALILPYQAYARTLDGTQIFAVTIDYANSAWSPTLQAYVIAAGVSSVTVPVIAAYAGIQGNVLASSIGLISGAGIPFVDTVINAAAFTNGIDAESDAAFRARFANYINTRYAATDLAVSYAVQSVQQGLSWSIAENQNVDGSTNMGNFIVTVDDGSGYPSAGLLARVTAAVNAIRPVGSRFLVQAPSVVSAAITYTITTAAGYLHSAQLSPSVVAVTAFVNALPIGAPLPWSRLAQVVYDSTPGISNVTLMQVNGGTADIGGGASQVVRASSVVAS